MALKSLQFIEVDTPHFDESGSPVGEQTWRFAVPTEYLPRDVDCIPSISAISYTPATISLGENLGERASVTITFKDHRHVMNGESFDSGTFFGKWRARYGQKLRARAVRWLNGLEGQALEDMSTRHFFIDTTDGPTPDGTYTIVAKDLLKFLDDDRAQAPVLSNGRLAGGLDNAVTAATLSPTGIGDEEYPASGYLCLGGKEIVSFVRGSPGDVLTITRGQLGTSAIEHEASERAQLVLYYDGDDVADIINDLLVNYAAVDSSYVPLSDWQAETAANLGVIYARAITEPTAVGKLVAELIEQAALALWWDELGQRVRLQVLREISTDAVTWDEDKILQGSLKVKEQPDKRISQIWTYFGQRNPADRGDNEDNYRAALADVDLERETEYGSPLVRKITGKWIATENAAQRLNQVQISRFRDPPRRFNFDLFPGASCLAGQGARVRWRQNQDVLGNIVEEGAPIQVTRVAVEAGVIRVEAEEMLASGVVILTNVVILTTTGSVLEWTVPTDWNDADNEIHVIGGGGGGGGGGGFFADGGSGGGAGAYSGINNLDLTPSATVQYRVGSGGDGGNGGFGSGTNGEAGSDTWFNGANLAASSVGAKAGTGGNAVAGTPGEGGDAAEGVGTVKTSGGDGDRGRDGEERAGGGGGGAAGGPNGDGGDGGNAQVSSGVGGAGGGGANDGETGNQPGSGADDTGGNGGDNRFNFGGGSAGSQPTDGGGGKGGDANQDGQPGGDGEQLWTQTVAPIISAGPGGGGGGGGDSKRGGNGGNYGGGGAGGGSGGDGGNGAQGVIVIIWTPA